MFPFIMTAAALVFFEPSWPRRLARRVKALLTRRPVAPEAPVAAVSMQRAPGRKAWVALGVAAAYGLLQVSLPLRTHLYGGNVLWHEQGMRFSWRVMAREKNGSVTFMVRNPATGREWVVSPRQYLNRLQEKEMSVQPDLILQLARRIARDFEAQGQGPVEVRADARVSLNGRPAALLVDPEVDLAREVDGLTPKPWILPAPDSPPIRLRPTLSASR
jgi:hypothetical protein